MIYIKDQHPEKQRSPSLGRALWACLIISMLLSPAIHATEQDASEVPAPAVPEWCDCQAVEDAPDEQEKAALLQELERARAQCLKALGVSVTHQRKGQGARIDACNCACINQGAEPIEGPWGDRKKSARPHPND
jgi:hypothetical protein